MIEAQTTKIQTEMPVSLATQAQELVKADTSETVGTASETKTAHPSSAREQWLALLEKERALAEQASPQESHNGQRTPKINDQATAERARKFLVNLTV